MTFRHFSSAVLIISLGLAACSGNDSGIANPGASNAAGTGGSGSGAGGGANTGGSTGTTGGQSSTGGSTNNGSGGSSATGGSASNGATGGASTGGAATGGGATGGQATGGTSSVTTGGSSAGGSATGGAATGGAATGGAATGGKAAGGSATGGKAAGGSATGGAATGGAGTGGKATGGAATGGAGTGGAATGGGTSTGLANFSFFVASEASLISLSGNSKGFGGDLRYGQTTGLAGADKICAAIAEISMPGSSAKQWRAFLSIAANGSETAVNAIDRVGAGPWYDRLGRVVSLNVTQLKSDRPAGANAAIIGDLPNEFGTPNHSPNGTQVDNHDTLTGSTSQGVLASTYANTCNNWTSAVSSTGKPVIGHSWTASSGTNWIQVGHTGGGCAPGASPASGAQSGETGTVGQMGGYGGFYCFALTP